jgi:hypothetical protein
MQLLLGSRAGDIEEPALLGEGVGIAGMGDGHIAVLEPRDEDDCPLEALCPVERGELDLVPTDRT